MKIFGRGQYQGQVSFAAHPRAGLTASRRVAEAGGHWLAGQKEKYRSPQVTTPRRGPKEDPAERLENSTGWRRDLCGGMGRGGALARDSSGVVTSCSAGDVSAGASRARVGEVELAQQLGRVLNLRLEVVIVWGGEGGCELR